MAKISFDGWVAEGGASLIETKVGNILIFDVVEELPDVTGIEEDKYGTNHAWFHCSMQIQVKDPTLLSFVPPGTRLELINSSGLAWLKKDEKFVGKDTYLRAEQVADFIQEGKAVHVSGQEILMEGPDGKILRLVGVDDLSFEPIWMREKPRLTKVPYKSGLYMLMII